MSRKPEWMDEVQQAFGTEWKWDVVPTPAVLPPEIQAHVDQEYATDRMGAHLDLARADRLHWVGGRLYAMSGGRERVFELKTDARTGQKYFFEV